MKHSFSKPLLSRYVPDLAPGILLLISIALLSNNTWSAGKAPDFDIETKTGHVNLKDLRGKVVYVDFWASWCAPCKKSFPWLNTMQEKYADKGLTIIGINVDKDPGLAEKFLEKTPANFTMAFDPEGELASKYKLIGMPSSYLIDRNGKIQYTHVGFRVSKSQNYEKSIQELLEK